MNVALIGLGTMGSGMAIQSGTKVKLLNNLLVGIQVASFAKMMGLAEHLGIDAEGAARFISKRRRAVRL